mmetsp:Transcript_33239/g.76708  ORF Transcript_33239/g.76708 Transcript_33239/m.76708 type:complete len:100 (-) Transcript_33239:196-495(-)
MFKEKCPNENTNDHLRIEGAPLAYNGLHTHRAATLTKLNVAWAPDQRTTKKTKKTKLKMNSSSNLKRLSKKHVALQYTRIYFKNLNHVWIRSLPASHSS